MVAIPASPIDSPAAWRGDELPAAAWLYEVSATEIDELRRATEQVKRQGLPIERIAIRNFPLPRFGPTLRRLGVDVLGRHGVVLLRGFPVADLPIDDIRLMYFGASVHLGVPIAQNIKNELLGDIRDEGEPYGAKVRGYQSNERLGYHNDSADIVGLCCVRGAKAGGVSKIVSAVTAHNLMLRERPDLLALLYEEPYYYAWKGEGPPGQLPYYWHRIFSWYEGRLSLRWVYSLLRQTQELYPDVPRLTPRQHEALDYFDGVVNRPELSLDMHFRPGDIQYLDNGSVVHSRTEFEDYDDPAKRRHLLRVWLNHYERRRVSPDFSDRYDQLGESTGNPYRKLFPVEVHDTW